MNTRRDKARFNTIQILLYSVCSPIIVMIRRIKKLKTKEDYVIQWNTQTVNITINLKVKYISP